MSGTRSTSAPLMRRMTRPIVRSSLSAGSPTLIVRPAFSLSATSLRASLNSPAWNVFSANHLSTTDRQRVAALRVRVGVGERALRRPQLVEGRGAERLLRLHHDDRRARLADDRLRHRPEQVAPVAAMPALDGWAPAPITTRSWWAASRMIVVPHARPLAQDADHAPPAAVLAHECVERLLLAGERPLADALRHDVHDHHLRAEALAQVAGEANGELGVRTAADRDQDRADVVEAALLDDRDVARRLADDGVDRGGEDRWRSRLGTRQPRLGGLRLGAGGLGRGARPRPAEDDEIASLPR